MNEEIIEKAKDLEDNGNLNECIKFIDENIGSVSDPNTRSDLLRVKSECYLYQETPNADSAKQFAEEALNLAQERNDRYREGECNLLLSQILVLNDNVKAVEYGRKALNIFQSLGDKSQAIYSMISLATILEDYGEASDLFEKAINEAEKLSNLDLLAQAAVNYSYLLLEEKGDDSSLKALDRVIDKVIAEASRLKRKDDRIGAVSNYSEIFDAASDIAMELEMYDLATKYASYLNKDPQEFRK